MSDIFKIILMPSLNAMASVQKSMIVKQTKYWLVLPLVMLFMAVNSIHAAINIEVIYPKEGSKVTAADSTFVFGNVTPIEVELTVNNIPSQIYPNGAFLAFVPVEPGNFSLICRALANKDTARVVRNIYIPHYMKTSTQNSLVIDTSYIFPKVDWELQPGDVFKVAVKGTPGCNATFSIEGLVYDLPMVEIAPKKSFYWGEAIFGQGTNSQMSDVRGIYTGAYIIQNLDLMTNREILFKIKNKAGKIVETVAPGRLTIDNPAIPKIAELSQEVTIAQTGPNLGYQLFLPEGVRVWIKGRRGNYLRARLSGANEVWIKDDGARMLASGTPLPEGVVTAIETEEFENKTRVKVFLDQKIPFEVAQIVSPPALLITLYGVTIQTDKIKLDIEDPLIREISWEQKTADVYRIKINLNQEQHWGYHPYYEDGNLYIDIKKKPDIHGWPYSPLKDRVICLDPGHGPELGAIGPKGSTEKDMNYKYCVALKNELENKGAFVVLTRGENYGASLKARTQLAIFMEADILLSLHFNALPDGVNPFQNHGISTYYYHPHSYPLAYSIQKMLLKHTEMKNFGLFFNNLTICRPPQTIAVLTEPGFIMHPWEEILISSDGYLKKVIEAIVKGIEEFLKESK